MTSTAMVETKEEKQALPYPELDPNPDFVAIEQNILRYWKSHKVFEASVENRAAESQGENNQYVFYDGPPFANGLPHYGHLLTGYVKDFVARYQTMRGHRTERRFGWDCHGLPAEMGAEKELGISGRQKIMEYGIDNFNNHCRTSVMKYTKEWENYVDRQARWVDFEHDYKTMDINFMESVLWAFKQLHEKGLIYESYRVMPYSWAAETPLSNFETKLDNSYREREDKAVTVAFELKNKPEGAPEADKYYVLAWTTTPWTLPSNLALAVSKEMEYVCVTKDTYSPRLRGEVRRGVTTRNPDAIKHAKELRKDPTEAEKALWQLLRDKQLAGYKFRRQYSVGKYITDFACLEKNLVVELDGGQHAEQQDYDTKRTQFLEEAGYQVLRFWNSDILENSEGVITAILEALNTPTLTLPRKQGREQLEQGGSNKVCYILAKSSLPAYEKEMGEEANEVLAGDNLLNLSYQPLFPYFKDQPNAFRILDGTSFIEEGEGTGVVHMAPAFGEDDQRVCAENGIDVVCPVDEKGRYTDAIFDLPHPRHPEEQSDEGSKAKETRSFVNAQDEKVGLKLKGLNVIADTNKEAGDPYNEKQIEKYGLANLRIIHWLKEQGNLIKQEDYKHNYPHCWRTDTPIIYKALSSWYVKVTDFRERAVELNNQINWIPSHVQKGAMGHMLATAPDWSISRNRFWGCPIPIWRSDNPDNETLYVFGSIEELEAFFEVKVEDLHRPFIDTLTKPDPTNPDYTLTRVEDVFDCWFESGSMPFAQLHYPFENKEKFEQNFPADFITEYIGQTRGWFNTLIMLSTALFDKPPFLNCICHGVVLDEETGLKYSKRLKNYKDPMEVFDTFGADALRWMMLSSPVMRGADIGVDPEGRFIRDALRLYIKPIWNAYNFFCMYANADNITASFRTDSSNIMDQYILAKCQEMVQRSQAALDAYEAPGATTAITHFLDVLNNWYIRRNKERFWKSELDQDKRDAYDTLYTIIHILARTAAPLLPLVCEEIFLGLTGKVGSDDPSHSVHLQNYPTELANYQPADQYLMQDMDKVRDICNVAHGIRNQVNIRIRQPLPSLTVYQSKLHSNQDYYASLITDETNVKQVHFSGDLESVAETRLKIHFPVAGKRLGAKMKQVGAAAKQGDWSHQDGTIICGGEALEAEEAEILLQPKESSAAQALSTNDGLVVLDTNITAELEAEGLARDMVRMIQQDRKEAGLHITNRIALTITSEPNIIKAVEMYKDYIAEQVLAEDINTETSTGQHQFSHKLEGTELTIAFSVAG